jgi:quaternary ammonium compound-resistance protein SugE
MAWLILVIAGACEIVWVVALRQSEGLTRPAASAVAVGMMIASFVLLAQAMKTIPMGVAYAAWTGIGAAGAFLAEAAIRREMPTPVQALCVALIIAGVVGLKLSAPQAR